MARWVFARENERIRTVWTKRVGASAVPMSRPNSLWSENFRSKISASFREKNRLPVVYAKSPNQVNQCYTSGHIGFIQFCLVCSETASHVKWSQKRRYFSDTTVHFHLPEQGEGCRTSEHSPDFYGRHHQGNYSGKKNLKLNLIKSY